METLLEDYKRKLNTITQMITDDNGKSESTLNRLKTKQGMIRSFIVDIERAMADTTNENSGLHLQRVTHRNLPTMEDIEKWNCPPAYLKDGKIMHRNWIDEETQFIHEMINDFNVAYYGG
jgi:hypothetical protein